MTAEVKEGDAEVKITVVQENDDPRPVAVISGTPALEPFDGLRPSFFVSFVCLLVIAMFAGLNSTILTTSVPHLDEQFGHGESGSWIINSYLLASLIFIPTTGHLSELMGRKTLMLASITVFTIGSGLCAISWNMYSLIVFRAIQGLGSGPIHSLSSIILHDLLPVRLTGKFNGISGIVVAISVVGGSAFGGLVADQGKNYWRVLFYVDVAIGIMTVVLLALFLKYEEERSKVAAKMEKQAEKHIHNVVINRDETKEELGDSEKNVKMVVQNDLEKSSTTPYVDDVQSDTKRSKRRILSRIDYLGITLLVTSIVLCLVSSSLASDGILHWYHPAVITMFTIGGIFFVCFILVELFFSKEPAMPIRLFIEYSSVFLTQLTKFFLFFILTSVVSYLPTYYQIVEGDSASVAGLKTLPIMISFIVSSVPSGLLLTYTGVAWPFPLVGFALTTLSLGLMTSFHLSTPYVTMAVYLSILGVGLGLANHAVTLLMVSPLDRVHHANLLSTQQFMQNAGSIVGVQCFEVALQTVLNNHLQGNVDADVTQLDREAIISLDSEQQAAVYNAYSYAFKIMFSILVPLGVVCFLLSAPLYRVKVPDVPKNRNDMPTSE